MSSPKHYQSYRVFLTDTALTKGLSSSRKDYINGTFVAKISGRIDSTAATATYYVHVLDTDVAVADLATGTFASIPATLLIAPIKIQHTTGTDSGFDVDIAPDYIKAKKNVVLAVSTTEFSYTKVGSDVLSANILTH